MLTRIAGGRVIDPAHRRDGIGDVWMSDGHIVDAPEPPRSVQPRQRIAGRKLTPADRQFAVESYQPWRRTLLHDFAKGRFVLLAGLLAVGATDAPIHAPAAIASTERAEEVL